MPPCLPPGSLGAGGMPMQSSHMHDISLVASPKQISFSVQNPILLASFSPLSSLFCYLHLHLQDPNRRRSNHRWIDRQGSGAHINF